MRRIKDSKILFFVALVLLVLSVSACEEPECKHENITFEIIDPTHKDCGYTKYSCPDCDYTYVEQYKDPISHSFQKTVTEPTCTTEGSTLNGCECGYSYISDVKAPLGHTYEASVIEPTCTDGGSTTYNCERCNDSYVSNLTDATGHTYASDVISPTCTTEGYTVYTCNCGYSYNSEYTKPLKHFFSEETTPPTCTSQGYTTFTCSCGYTFTLDYTSPTEHTLDDTITPATCSEEGFTTHTCECGYTFTDTYVAPLGHTYTSEILSEATCTAIGETKFTCTCGETYSITVEPLGHDYKKSVYMPTLSDMGYTVYTCEICEHTYTGDLSFYGEIVTDAYAESTTVLANGIDVSYHNYKQDQNGNYISLDWESIKNAGITYVIIRIADAAIGIDPTFEKSYTEAKAAGLDVGFYFYTRAQSKEEITLEANLVLSALQGKQFEYPVYLDVEDEELRGLGASILNEMCVTFFTTLQRAGYYTGLYVNDEWLYNVIDTDTAISRFDIWYARYPQIPEGQPTVWDTDTQGSPFGMWQYTDSGVIEGIDHTVFDLNYCYKDYPSIVKEYGFNGYESDFNYPDTDRSFVWVIHQGSIKIRSKADYFTNEYHDAELDVIGYAKYGSRFEVIEQNELYTAIKYEGKTAYISANPQYISFNGLYIP